MTAGTVGRIVGTVGLRTRRIVYGTLEPDELVAELTPITQIDLAHVVMLATRGLITRDAAAALLREVSRLRDTGFADLLGRPAPRGAYLMYEQYLAEVLSEDVGGCLHTGRSRNDLKATVTALALRDWAARTASETVRLGAVLLARARAGRDVVMPVHTHFQAAMPVTYGWYLVGIAEALLRDVAALLDVHDATGRCPMGAGAVAGSDLPIDPAQVAGLLGFSAPVGHALDAVASRDAVLRAAAAAAGTALTVSRLAADLQLWSTAEFGFVRFPDRLVGGSSAMPQKRNAFLLENVRGKAAATIGAWTSVAAALRAAPFTNGIEAGTEAVTAVWPGLLAATDTVLLGQVLVSGARPDADRTAAVAATQHVTATVVANRLVRAGMPFRSAHGLVGDAVRAAVEDGTGGPLRLPAHAPEVIDPELSEAVAALRYGGGPGAFADLLDAAHTGLVALAGRLRRITAAQEHAAHRLTAAVDLAAAVVA